MTSKTKITADSNIVYYTFFVTEGGFDKKVTAGKLSKSSNWNGDKIYMKKLISKLLIILLMLYIPLGYTVQASDLIIDIVVYSEDELIEALADSNVQIVNIGSDIEITSGDTVYINGDNKYINGNSHSLNIANENFKLTSNVKIGNLKDLIINSAYNVDFLLKYGGYIENLQGANLNVTSDSKLELHRSSLASVSINYGHESEIVDSMINGQGINLYDSQNTVIDKVSIDLGDVYTSGIVLTGRTSASISNTTIIGGIYGVFSDVNGMTSTITNTQIQGSKNNGIYNNGDVNGSSLILSDVEISDTGSYGIYNTGTNSKGYISVEPGKSLTLNTGDNIGIYQDYGYLNVSGKVIHNGSHYTLFNSSNSTIHDPNEMMELISQNDSYSLYNSINRSGKEVVLASMQVSTEEELRKALMDKEISNVQLSNDIEIIDSSGIEVNGILKKLSGGNFKLVFGEDLTPQITANEFIDVENLNIENDISGWFLLNKGGNINNLTAPKINMISYGQTQVLGSGFEGTQISNGNKSKITNSKIGTSGIYLYLSQDTIIDNVSINLGDAYSSGITLSGRTGTIISNTTITGGSYGIYSYMNGMSSNITNTQISGSRYYGIYNDGDVNGSSLILSDVEISDTGSYGVYNTGTNSTGNISVEPGKSLTLNTGNNIGIYQEYGYLNVSGELIHNGSHYTLFNSSNSTIHDPNEMMKLISQNDSFSLYNSISRFGEEVVLASVQVSTEEELRNALLDEEVNKVQLSNDIEIFDSSTIEAKGILKKLSGEDFKLVFGESVTPQVTLNEFIDIENLTIENNIPGWILLNKGGNIKKLSAPKMSMTSYGQTQILDSEMEGTSINNGNKSKVTNSTIGASGIYLNLSQNTIIDKVIINMGDAYSSGITLSGRTTTDISNTTINGGSYGIYSYMNGVSFTITNTEISGSRYNGIYNNGGVNGSSLFLSDVDISDTGSYGIYNTGRNSHGYISVEPGTALTLNTGDTTGIYQEKGYFVLNGKIISTNSGVLISSDYKSETIYSNQLICLNPLSSSFKNYILDVIAPNAPIVNDVYEQSTEVVGKSESGANILVEIDSVKYTGKADENGDFSIKIPQQKVNTLILVKATDTAGNVSEATIIKVFDNTAPDIPQVDEVTDQSKEVTGTAQPGSTVGVKIGDASYEAQVDEQGRFSVSIPAQKANTFIFVFAYDAFGNTSSYNMVTVKDVTAPQSPKVQEVTDQSTEVSGSAESNSEVTVVAGTNEYTAFVDQNGNFTVTIPVQKAGTELIIIATDKAGNASDVTKAIVKDATAPAIPEVDPFSDQDKVMTGKAEADSTITLEIGDEKFTGIAANGIFTIELPQQKANTNIAVYATDQAGNKSETVTLSVSDKTVPIVEGVKNEAIYNRDVTISFNEGTGKLNGNEITSGTVIDEDGSYLLEVEDAAGNKAEVRFVIDKTAPEVKGVEDGGFYNTDVTIEFNEGTAVLNGETITSNQVIQTEGNYELEVIDQAGNVTKRNFTIDKTAPKVIGVADNGYYNKAVTINFNEGTAKLNSTELLDGIEIKEEGSYLLEVVDAAGNKAIVSFIIDNTVPEVKGVEDGAIYNTDVTIQFDEGSALLNGDVITTGQVIQAEGNYELEVTDQAGNVTKRNFTIDKTAPKVIGVADKENYNKAVTINFNEGTAKLNGSDFLDGTVIGEEGSYLLEIVDEAGNKTRIEFIIDKTAPQVTGIEDERNYNKDVTINFNEGTAKLNGNVITSGAVVDEEGSYLLEVEDAAGNKTIVSFVIDKTAPEVKGVEDGAHYNKDVTIEFDEGTALLNGKAITNGQVVQAEGNYKLQVIDLAGNETILQFAIDKSVPEVAGVESDAWYNHDVTITFTDGKGLLNGKPFESGSVVAEDGDYELEVKDVAGNLTTVHFIIDKISPVVTGVENNAVYNKEVTLHFNEGVATLNGEKIENDSVINTDGEYILEVTDQATNKTVVKFSIDQVAPEVEGIEDNAVYNEDVTVTFNEGEAKLNGLEILSGTIVEEEGKYELEVTDEAGNKTAISFIIDKTGPVAPTLDPIGDAHITLTGVAEPNVKVTAIVMDKVIGTAKSNEQGYFAITIEKQQAGTTVSVFAEDAVGNIGKSSTVVVKDITAPSQPVVNEVTEKTTLVTGEAEAGSNVEAKVGSEIIGTAVAGKDGRFSINIPAQKAGIELVITVSDAAGNLSEAISVTVKAVQLDGWIKKDENLYYYTSGQFVTGWKLINNKWYFFNSTGIMQTGWVKSGTKWYYLDGSGIMKTGWLKDGTKWYYLESSGAMKTGWLKDGGKWYYLESSGAMKTGWLKSGGKWYFLENSGVMKTGWLKSGGKWYFLDNGGVMKTGWIQSGGKWYYLYSSGVMAYSTTVGGYRLGADGAWIQ